MFTLSELQSLKALCASRIHTDELFLDFLKHELKWAHSDEAKGTYEDSDGEEYKYYETEEERLNDIRKCKNRITAFKKKLKKLRDMQKAIKQEICIEVSQERLVRTYDCDFEDL